MKTCSCCKEAKSYKDFYTCKSLQRPDGHQPYCKSCEKAKRKTEYAANPEKFITKTRKADLKRFGLTPEIRDEMEQRQNGLCAICGKPETSLNVQSGQVGALHVDHNHQTLQVRDLLCGNCNRGLGLFKENPSLLTAAAWYLERHKHGTSTIW